MHTKGYYLTQDGYDKFIQECVRLRTIERPKVIEALVYAIDLGDLPENAEYDAASKRQLEIDQRIEELEHILDHAIIIEKNTDHSFVSIGSKVTVLYLDDNETDTYEIVGSKEVDALAGRISNESPLGKALLNKKVEEVVTISSPTMTYQVKIIKIQ